MAVKPRKIIEAAIILIVTVLVLLALSAWTRHMESRQAVRDMTEALQGVLEEKGEKGLLEYAGADPDKLYYEYEGVPSYIGERPAWEYSSQERKNMSVFSSAASSVVKLEAFSGASRSGEGAGVVYSSDGYIITNRHVLGDGDTFTVRFYDGSSAEASLEGADAITDVAVLKTEAEGLRPLAAGSAEDTMVGEEVYAIGHPFGYGWTFSKGMITGKDRLVASPEGSLVPGLLQTDAAINPGNSGGPLLSTDGRMIGLVSSIYSPSGYDAGVAFALPVDAVFRAADEIIATGTVRHGWLDIVTLEVNPSISERSSLPVSEGMLVSQVMQGGEAAKGGLKGGSKNSQLGNNVVYLGGDIITSINGEEVRSASDYARILSATRAGDTAEIGIIRGGRELTLRLVLAEQTEENSRWLVR